MNENIKSIQNSEEFYKLVLNEERFAETFT